MEKLTKKEYEVLKAIVESEFQDNEIVDCPVWIDCLDNCSDSKVLSGVVSSLTKKGYVVSDYKTIAITKTGFLIYSKGI